MKITVYIEPNTGKEYRALPTNWDGKVSPLTATNCQSFGWVIEEREIEEPKQVNTYSKLKIIRAAKDASIWEAVKSAIEEAGYWDEFVCAQDLSDGDERFDSFVTTAKTTYGEETVNSILEAAKME